MIRGTQGNMWERGINMMLDTLQAQNGLGSSAAVEVGDNIHP